KNSGAAAGASLEHSHSQLIVTPIVPINVWEEMTGSLEFFGYRGRCIYCDMIHQEMAAEKRLVMDTPNFVAFCPYAGRFPFETWIPAKNPQQPLREHSEERGGRAGNGAEDHPPQTGIGPGSAGLQLHHPHRPVRYAIVAALPLAPGNHPAP